jgi:hypothetical protein
VHDDAIQSELTNITEGQLEFTNTPYVKAYRPQPEREGRDRGGYGKQRSGGGKFQRRDSRDNGRNDNRNRHSGKKRFK